METQEVKIRISIPLEDGYAKSYFRKQGKTKEQVLAHILSLNPDTKREAIIKYVDELFS